ncbi:MAG TPA: hypothetical protein VN436_04670, partial [Holophaga sp.]|nr:hypothetical protein [Holophaga sp.]
MKRLAIVTETTRTSLGPALRENLEEILRGKVEIREYSFDRLEPEEQLEADLALVMLKSKALGLKRHVSEARQILVVQRTIREERIYPIFAIPPGTRVLVVNDHPETTLETVALLQQLEINHLQFVPFEEGMDCGDLRIAITPGERARVPDTVATVIDLGHRCIDISTFLEIIDRLGLSDPEVDRRLLRYAEGIVTLDMGVNRQFKELYRKHAELDTIINLAHEGILLVNPAGAIALHNRALAEMLGLPGDAAGAPTSILPPAVQ